MESTDTAPEWMMTTRLGQSVSSGLLNDFVLPRRLCRHQVDVQMERSH